MEAPNDGQELSRAASAAARRLEEELHNIRCLVGFDISNRVIIQVMFPKHLEAKLTGPIQRHLQGFDIKMVGVNIRYSGPACEAARERFKELYPDLRVRVDYASRCLEVLGELPNDLQLPADINDVPVRRPLNNHRWWLSRIPQTVAVNPKFL
jgi:hypothetical protein